MRELLYHVNGMLEELGNEVTVFEQEFFPEQTAANQNDPYTVEYDAANQRGDQIEKRQRTAWCGDEYL